VWFNALTFGVFGQGKINNQMIIERELKSGVDSLLIPALTDSGEEEFVIRYNDHISDEKIAFLKTFFIGYLNRKGKVVHADSADYELKIEQFDINIVYHETDAALWGVSDNLQRTVYIKLNGWIKREKYDQYLPLDVENNYSDFITRDAVSWADKSPYSFTAGQLAKKRSWKNYIEPLVVSISTAAVVLLLFVLRT
jgi:hypothetical protein